MPEKALCCPHDPYGNDRDIGYCPLAVVMDPPYSEPEASAIRNAHRPVLLGPEGDGLSRTVAELETQS